MAKQVGATVELRSPGRDAKQSHTKQSHTKQSHTKESHTKQIHTKQSRVGYLVVEGDPGELTMFASGRQKAAQVEITGDEELAFRLRNARLGI